MNTEEAREYFKPLTYNDITEEDIIDLRCILSKHILKRNEIEEQKYKQTGQRDYVYKLCPFKKNQEVYENGHVKYVHLQVLCDNYSRREAISFNRDGFIGFAGWASSYNTDLFVNAFIEWIDYIKIKKQENINHLQDAYTQIKRENKHLEYLSKQYEQKIQSLTLQLLMLEKQYNQLLDNVVQQYKLGEPKIDLN